ncbi:MAG: RHS repeat-associated core domain-containing protein, partial [Blastocatellia bacterium]|nr:RHS repeat-associated core domain-containing protein [Blastocatellia bacterium]
SHSQVLSGLTTGTLYHYRVKSRDAAGNQAVSGDFSFTATQNGSIPLDGLGSLSYNPTNNRINSAGFEYDPAGNQTRAATNASGTEEQYLYDSAGRLAQVLDGDGHELASYSYGASNQRLMSVEGGETKYYAWAGGQIIAEYEGTGTSGLVWKTSYVYFGGQLLATTTGADGNETRFHHPDRLGTRLVTDAGGEVVSEQLSMPFGTMLPFSQVYGGEGSYQNPGIGNPSKKRFTSYDRSDATGLDYAVNRHYSSAQGRFTQVDPLEMGAVSLTNPQTLNLYAYCGNDPVNNLDPAGTSFFGKLFGWIGKIFKWVAIAVIVAVAVLTVVSASWAGTVIGSIINWAGNHEILASLFGLSGKFGSFGTPPFVNDFLQTQDDSSGGFFEKLGNWLSGNGWNTDNEVKNERARAYEAKRNEAAKWLKANGWPAEFIDGLSAEEQIALYEKAKNGEPISINIIVNGPEFPNLKDHARRHAKEGQSAEEYYQDAINNTLNGRRFQVRHDGQNKLVYITRTGPNNFTFTSTSMNGRTIFTHLYDVSLDYLRNKGITLPRGF